MNAFLIHGAFGDGTENWFPWLKLKLEDLGYEVFTPRFPTPVGQSLENWLTVFSEYKDNIDKDTILIGHSIGCAFILNVLEHRDHPLKAIYLVAGFISLLNSQEVDPLNKTFTEKPFNWEKIKKNTQKIQLFNSDNDPYVTVQKAEEIGHTLQVPIQWVHNAGHFNTHAGYITFPLLLEKINEDLSV